MKTTKENRMVIAYMPVSLHKEIRKWCIKHDMSLSKWAEMAHKSLLGKD